MTNELETDYLVIGAGAGAMAITDELLTHSKATITIVDQRHAPGGHWIDAYPFVRLHQPSAFYGVSSTPLGDGSIDAQGTNAGYYELAGADELRAYYERVMHRRFLPTGRVQYFPSSEYLGDGQIVSRMGGASRQARVRKKTIDTTHLQGTIPATSAPPFEVADGARCVALGEIPHLRDEPPERYVIVGAGKTAVDACTWLMQQGVSASAICWIKPREAWWINRRYQQPLTMLAELHRGVAIQIEAMAAATSVDDVFLRLEQAGFFLRIDPKLSPTMFRGAIVSEGEIEALRRIENVVRMGHVKRIDRDAIVLEGGTIPTNTRTLHVHGAASALVRRPLRPIFEPGRMTLQPHSWGFYCYQAALLGVMEATIESDAEKNGLCPPMHYWDRNEDFLRGFLSTMVNDRARATHPALAQWIKTTRLNPASGLSAYREHDDVKETRERIKRAGMAAAMNLQTMLAG